MDKKKSKATSSGRKGGSVSKVIEEMPVGVVFFDADGDVIGGNHLWREYFNFSEREAEPGTRFDALKRAGSNRDSTTYDSAGRKTEALAAAFEPAAMEGRFTARIDENRWLDIRNRRTDDGGVVSVQADITEQVAQHERLSNEQSILQSAITAMPAGISIKDPDGRYRAYNDKIVELFDLPDGMIHEGSSFEEVARYQAARGDHGNGQVDDLVTREVDILRSLDVTVYERTLATGRTLELRRSRLPDGGVVTIAADVTDRVAQQFSLQQAKEEAELASISKTEFLANLSHELRTPLNSVIGFSDIMARQTLGPMGTQKYLEYANSIRNAGQHLLAVVNDILDVSKIEVGEFSLHEEQVSIPHLIADCVRMVADSADQAEVRLHESVPAGFPMLRADPLRLRQILLNLLSNALKFTPPGGHVRLSAKRRDDGAPVIEVSDTGIGIEPEDIPRALEPFRQVGDHDSAHLDHELEGTGLGLPLARALTELHGGRLEIASTAGKGTTVRIRLRADCIVGH